MGGGDVRGEEVSTIKKKGERKKGGGKKLGGVGFRQKKKKTEKKVICYPARSEKGMNKWGGENSEVDELKKGTSLGSVPMEETKARGSILHVG